MHNLLRRSAGLAVFTIFLLKNTTLSAQNTGIVVTRQPTDQTVCPGVKEAVFTVEARSGGDSPVEYQWLVSTDGGQDFTAAPSGTGTSFSIPAAVWGIFPKLKIKARLTAKNCQPTETTVASLVGEGAVRLRVVPKEETIVTGGNAIFELKIEAGEADLAQFTHQWQRSRYATGVFEDLPGETSPMLWLKKIPADLNGNLFRCIVRGGGICDKLASEAAVIFVENAPLVSLAPAEKTVCEHGSASFGVQIKNGTGKEKYRWQVSRDGGKLFTDLPGETGKTFEARDLSPELSGSLFRAVVEGPGGSEFLTNAARVTVSGTISIAQQPAHYLACPGDSAVFSMKVRASGAAASYQWQTSLDSGNTWSDLPGKRGETMSALAVDEAGAARLFRCMVTAGQCGQISSATARLDVVKTITFSQQSRYSVADGQTVEIRTQPTASPGTFLGQWQFSLDGGASWTGLREANAPVLTIPNASPALDGRLYRYKTFSKECGRIFFSEPIVLEVKGQK